MTDSRTGRAIKRRIDEALEPIKEFSQDIQGVYDDIVGTQDTTSMAPKTSYRPSKKARKYKGGRTMRPLYSRPFAESKYIDNDFAGSGLAVASGATGINLIGQGDDVSNRSGRIICMTGINVYGIVRVHASAVSTFCRIALVYDRQPNASGPGMTNLLVTDSPYSLHRHDYSDRFVFLKEWIFALNVYDQPFKVINYNKRWKKSLVTKYISTGSAITDVGTGSLILCYAGSDATYTPSMYLKTRVWFKDQ